MTLKISHNKVIRGQVEVDIVMSIIFDTRLIVEDSVTLCWRVIDLTILIVLIIQMTGEISTKIVDMNYEKHYQAHKGKNKFARGIAYINGIESFWSYAKSKIY